MSTYANISINDKELHIASDGGDRELILDIVKSYVRKYRGFVAPSVLAEVVGNSIVADALESCSSLALGFVERPSYSWRVYIGPRGGVKIRGGKAK